MYSDTILYMKQQLPLDTHSTDERQIIDFGTWGWKDIAVLGKYHYTQARACLDNHQHRQMLEICFCSKGEQVYEVNGNLYKIKGGEIFITYPGELHGTGQFPEEKGEMYWLIIKCGNKSSFLQYKDTLAAEWYRQLLQLPRHFKGSRGMKKLLEKTFQHFDSQRNLMDRIIIQHQLEAFLLEVVRCSQSAITHRRAERLDRIDDFISTHLEDPVMLIQLADITGLSLSRFKTWFKEETGITPLDYVLKYKIKKAGELLTVRKLSVREAAFETGFQSPQYFATVFKKFTGLTPGNFKLKC